MSNHLRKYVKVRMLLTLLGLALLFFSLTAAPSSKLKARASGGDETHITYYTDATLTTQCGYTVILCQGWRAHQGCTTSYFTESYFPCECDQIDPC